MVIITILTGLLLFSFVLRPVRPNFNYAETKRRKNKLQTDRSLQYRRLATVFELLQYLLLVTSLIVASNQLITWQLILYGLGLVGLAVLARPIIASLKVSQQLYRRIEPQSIKLAQKLTKFSRWLSPDQSLPKLGSKEDLLAIVTDSPRALTEADRQRLEHSLSYTQDSLGDIMLDWPDVETVDRSELLGPLRLDELHKTGYSQFPVLDKSSLVGLLDIAHLVTLKNKRSLTAGSSMGEVYTIKVDRSIDAALKEFAINSQTFLVVVDAKNKPIGLLGLADTLQAVTGQNYK